MPSVRGQVRPAGQWEYTLPDLTNTSFLTISYVSALIIKKIKFSSYIRKLRVEQLQSHICMTNGLLLIYVEIFLHFLIYEEAPPHI